MRIELIPNLRWWLGFVMALLFLWSPAPAGAEEEVQRVYQQGIEQVRQENYRRALAIFERAYRIMPVPRILRDMGMCHRVLGNTPQSVNAFRLYFHDEDPAQITQELRDHIEGLMREMRPRHGDIELDVTLAGATILVDGREVGFWPVTTLVAVRPGAHIVIARREGYRDARGRVTVGGGATARIHLDPQPIDPNLIQRDEPPGEPEPESSGDEDEAAQPSDVAEPLPEPPPPIEPDIEPEPAPEGRGLGWWFWTSVALSGATSLGAVVTGSLMLHNRSEYELTSQNQYDLIDSLALTTDILIGIATGAALAGVISLIIHYLR